MIPRRYRLRDISHHIRLGVIHARRTRPYAYTKPAVALVHVCYVYHAV